MAKTTNRVCGFCLSAPAATDGPAKAHSRCAVRFGHSCDCADRDHKLNREIADRMALYLGLGQKVEVIRWIFKVHGQTLRELSEEHKQALQKGKKGQ